MSNAVRNSVHKCELQPAIDEKPNHVALEEKVIQFDEHRYWLFTAVDPETNIILHIRLLSTTTTTLTEQFLQELTKKHDLGDAMFLVDRATFSRLHSVDRGSDFDTKNMAIETLLNVSSKL